MVGIEGMALPVVISVKCLGIGGEILGAFQVQSQGSALYFDMQFIAVYYDLVDGDALFVPLDKCDLYIWADDDFMKMVDWP
jgi:hypothetical protein